LPSVSNTLGMLSRSAVYVRNGVVASSQPLAVSAGLHILRAGGSFVDAAIATSAVLCVVEPWASHLGGDAFVVWYDAARRRTRALNGSGAAPQTAMPERFPNGIPLRGVTAATMPGLVDAWFRLHALHGRLPMAHLLEPAIEYAEQGYPISERKANIWRSALALERAQAVYASGKLRDTNTTYFCVADRDGNAISFIQSVYHPFGSGVVVDGILLNNRMRSFSLRPDSPNRLAPGKRPMHTLNAYLITRGDALAYVGGTPGGDIQVQTNLQVISRLIDDGMEPQQAIEQPRWAWQPAQSTDPSAGTLSLEAADDALLDAMRQRGHSVRTTPLGTHPSAVQVIQRVGECYCAGSDPRAEGHAGGY
jgi:gamma-glutamyltranspeptidase